MATISTDLATTPSFFCIRPEQLEKTPEEWRDICLRALNGSCAYVIREGIFRNICSLPADERNCSALYQPEHISREDVERNPF